MPRPFAVINEEYFLSRSHVDERGCWIWGNYVNEHGYGYSFRQPAHRLAYTALVGPIPEGLVLDHRCHTSDAECRGGLACLHRRCVNPAHLEPVTQAENLRRSLVNADRRALTHCSKGHPYDERNTYWRKGGGRDCRACGVERTRAYLRRLSGVAA